MSRKKISTTINFEDDVLECLLKDALNERRSRSFIVDKVLRKHYGLPWEMGAEETADANKT